VEERSIVQGTKRTSSGGDSAWVPADEPRVAPSAPRWAGGTSTALAQALLRTFGYRQSCVRRASSCFRITEWLCLLSLCCEILLSRKNLGKMHKPLDNSQSSGTFPSSAKPFNQGGSSKTRLRKPPNISATFLALAHRSPPCISKCTFDRPASMPSIASSW
jgi:hypothetical protein